MGNKNGKTKTDGVSPMQQTVDYPQNEPPVIAAIDFGTAFTGYAFTFRRDSKEVKKWRDHDSKREPTCALLRRGQLEQFGTAALNMYANIDKAERDNYYLFKYFKITLFEKDGDDFLKVKDIQGREYQAMELFKVVFNHLKQKIVEDVKRSKFIPDQSFTETDIEWILTIPATWGSSRRELVEGAAEKAGIDVSNVRLVLEPEAASLYIRSKKLQYKQGLTQLSKGKTYLLADLGGGTVDICVHKILADGNLRELHNTGGCSTGGVRVNKAFEECLCDLFGKSVVTKFQDEYMYRYFELQDNFERIKLEKGCEDISLTIDGKLLDILKTETNASIKEMVASNDKLSSYVRVRDGDRLEIGKELMAKFFDTSISNITSCIREILETRESGVDVVFLSGGFSASSYVKMKIQETIPSFTQLVVVPNASIAVLEGALEMALAPKSIIERMSPFTYGFYSVRPFVEGEHPDDLKTFHEGVPQCSALFHKLIEKGTFLTFEKTFSRDSSTAYLGVDTKMQKRYTTLWRSSKLDPKYCTHEDGCYEIARIEISPQPEGWPDELNHSQQIIVRENEFLIKFVNRDTKEEYKTNVSRVYI